MPGTSLPHPSSWKVYPSAWKAYCHSGSVTTQKGTPWYWHLVAATEVGRTYPIGMHTCCLKIFHQLT